MKIFIIAMTLILPRLAEGHVYVTTISSGPTNAITFAGNRIIPMQIRTATAGQESSTTATGSEPLSVNAGLGGVLNLNTVSSGSIVIGLNPSIFSASGSLTLANNGGLALSGAVGNITSLSSVTASAFFGDGSKLTGIPASYMPSVPIFVNSGTPANTISLSPTQILLQDPQVVGQTSDFQIDAIQPGASAALTLANGDNTARYQIVANDSPGNKNLLIGDVTTGNVFAAFAQGAPNGSLFLSSSGNFGIGAGNPSNTLEVNGGINIDNTKNCTTSLQTDANGQIICAVSDAKMKTNILPLISKGSILDSLSPHFFTYKSTATRGSQQHAGFIAEEVAAAFPEAAVPAGFEIIPSTYSIWNKPHTFDAPMYQAGPLDAKGHPTPGKTINQTHTTPGYWTKAPPSEGAPLMGVEPNALIALLWTEVQNLHKRDAAREIALQGLRAQVAALEAAHKK